MVIYFIMRYIFNLFMNIITNIILLLIKKYIFNLFMDIT